MPPSVTRVSGGETSAAITPLDLGIRLAAFAHDSMMGRQAGTYWGEKAGDYVADQFKRLGVQPAGENGGYFQVVPGITPRDATMRPARRETSSASFPVLTPRCAASTSSITAHNDHIGFTHRVVDHDSLRAFNAHHATARRRQSAAPAVAGGDHRDSRDPRQSAKDSRASTRFDQQWRRRRRQRNDRADRDRGGVHEGEV